MSFMEPGLQLSGEGRPLLAQTLAKGKEGGVAGGMEGQFMGEGGGGGGAPRFILHFYFPWFFCSRRAKGGSIQAGMNSRPALGSLPSCGSEVGGWLLNMQLSYN